MVNKFFILLFSFSIFFSYTIAHAADFSGTYLGIQCDTQGCLDGEVRTGILGGLMKNKKPKTFVGIIHVEHDQKTDTLMLFFSEWKRLEFKNIPLDGDTFSGGDKKGSNLIKGFFTGDTIQVDFIRYAGSSTEDISYYRASLTEHEIEYRQQKNLLSVKENEIESVENEKRQLNSTIETLKNRVQENSQDIAALKVKNSKLISDNEIAIQNKDKEIKNIINKNKIAIQNKDKEIKDIKAKKDKQIADALNQLQKEIIKPIKIDSSFLPNNAKVNSDVNIRTSPSVESKIIDTLSTGAIVTNLAVIPPDYDWSFVVTKNGLVGYVKAIFIVPIEVENGSLVPPVNDTKNKINITVPKWDSGQENKRISKDAPGFITIEGNINLDTGITEALLNDNVIDDLNKNSGSFEAYTIVQSGKNDFSIVVIDSNNDRHELNFIIVVP